jgi:hypothetical protein
MDLAGCGLDLFEALTRHLPGLNDSRKASVSIANIRNEIRTEDLSNISTALVLEGSCFDYRKMILYAARRGDFVCPAFAVKKS